MWLVMSALCVWLLIPGCGAGQEEEAAGKPGAAAQVTAPEEGAAEPVVAQKLCPVMGRPVVQSIYVDYEGRRVYFCCQECVGKFKDDPAKYLAKLDEQLAGAHESAHEGEPDTHEGSDTHH